MLRGELNMAEECGGSEGLILPLTSVASTAEQELMSLHGLQQEVQAHICLTAELSKSDFHSKA